jgi:uncharacterized membrane protein
MVLTPLVTLIIFALTIDKREYITLWQKPIRQTGVLACSVVLALLWQIKAGILPYLNIHILGITAITLVLGWRLASLSALLTSLLLLVFGTIQSSEFAEFYLFTALLPILVSYGLFVFCYSKLPRHFFVYIFVCAFLCAGCIGAFKILSSGAYYWLIDAYTFQQLLDNYLFYATLIWFPEAMLNGMAITLLITYKPHWVKTFYDKEYLDK